MENDARRAVSSEALLACFDGAKRFRRPMTDAEKRKSIEVIVTCFDKGGYGTGKELKRLGLLSKSTYWLDCKSIFHARALLRKHMQANAHGEPAPGGARLRRDVGPANQS